MTNSQLPDNTKFWWSLGKDERFIKKTNAMFLVSEKFLHDLFEKHDLNILFLESRKELVYTNSENMNQGREIYSEFWYALTEKT